MCIRDREYYSDGRMESEAEYRAGKLHGRRAIYDRTGAVERTEEWRDGEIVTPASPKT